MRACPDEVSVEVQGDTMLYQAVGRHFELHRAEAQGKSVLEVVLGYDRTRLSTAGAVWARATVKDAGQGPSCLVSVGLGSSSSAPTPLPATRRRPRPGPRRRAVGRATTPPASGPRSRGGQGPGAGCPPAGSYSYRSRHGARAAPGPPLDLSQGTAAAGSAPPGPGGALPASRQCHSPCDAAIWLQLPAGPPVAATEARSVERHSTHVSRRRKGAPNPQTLLAVTFDAAVCRGRKTLRAKGLREKRNVTHAVTLL